MKSRCSLIPCKTDCLHFYKLKKKEYDQKITSQLKLSATIFKRDSSVCVCIKKNRYKVQTKSLMVVGICHCLINPGDYFVQLNGLNHIFFKTFRLYFVRSLQSHLSKMVWFFYVFLRNWTIDLTIKRILYFLAWLFCTVS